MLEVRSNKCYPTFIKNIKVFIFTDIVVLWVYEAASICNTNLVGGPRHGSSKNTTPLHCSQMHQEWSR